MMANFCSFYHERTSLVCGARVIVSQGARRHYVGAVGGAAAGKSQPWPTVAARQHPLQEALKVRTRPAGGDACTSRVWTGTASAHKAVNDGTPSENTRHLFPTTKQTRDKNLIDYRQSTVC